MRLDRLPSRWLVIAFREQRSWRSAHWDAFVFAGAEGHVIQKLID